MGRVFVDTSAILALRNASDVSHTKARTAFQRLVAATASLITTSYVLCETYALLHSRLGRAEVAAFREAFAPLLDVRWVDEDLHERGLDLLHKSRLRGLSLVDAVSFAAMREARVATAFAFDRHFEAQGFECV